MSIYRKELPAQNGDMKDSIRVMFFSEQHGEVVRRKGEWSRVRDD